MRRETEALGIVLSLVWATPVASLAAGLINNADFGRAGVNGELVDWRVRETPLSVCRVADDDGRSGKESLRLSSEADAGVVVPPVTQVFTCKANQEYVLSVWSKSTGGLRPIVRVRVPGDQRHVAVQIRGRALDAWRRSSGRFNWKSASTLT